MNRLLNILSVALVALYLPAAVLAGTGGGASMPSEQTYFAGPDKVVDLVNDVALDLPAGWSATVPGTGASGAMTASNYDKAGAEPSKTGRGTHTLTSDMAKFDVITYEMGSARTLAGWVKQYQARPNIDGVVLATSESVSYQLAGRQGQAYVLYAAEHSPLVVVLPWTAGKVLLAAVAPANSVNMERALAVLDTLRPVSGEAQASPSRDLVAPIRELVDAEIARAGGSLSDLVTIDATAAQCTSWSGTDNGRCDTGHSCAGNTPITLYLPFQYQTWWMAGGVGSFFGNFYHGNCNKDYYAIDFNLYSSSSCSTSLNDIGQNVYAAANGTASSGYEAGGYGNYVLVVHSSNVRTRYAHLSSIKTTGTVTTQTIIGLVGDTGSAAGAPHLHFGFQGKNTSGVYVSYCNKSGGCPNGEAAASPQSAKPNPMSTNGGSLNMSDGGCYQGPP